MPSNDTGKLPLSILKQAVVELSGDEAAEMRARLDAWWAYNELYNDMSDGDIPAEEKEYNRANMQQLLNYYLKQEPSPYTLIFELMRLLGQIEEYQELLDSITYEVFAAWRHERHQENLVNTIDVELVERQLYRRFVEEKRRAIERPRKVYLIQ